MTLKIEDCPMCGNRGKLIKITAPPIDIFGDSLDSLLVPFPKEEVYCDCYYGQSLEVFDNRCNHPEYVNPLEKLTDNEILALIDQTEKQDRIRQEAIDSEFKI